MIVEIRKRNKITEIIFRDSSRKCNFLRIPIKGMKTCDFKEFNLDTLNKNKIQIWKIKKVRYTFKKKI